MVKGKICTVNTCLQIIIQNGSNKKMKNQLIHQLMPPLIGDDKEVKIGT